MKTTQISQLKEQGFTVNKTPEMQTVVSHSKPFIVHGDKGVYKAPLKEGSYQITFASMCSNGATPFIVEQTAYPFINDMQARLDESQRLYKQQQENRQHGLVVSTFDKIEEGTTFYKDESKNTSYRKTGSNTYVKCSKLIESFDLIGRPDMQVHFESFDSNLSMEQKQQLVADMPPGMSPDDFHETLGMALEDVPGVETMDENQLMELHKELFAMYRQTHNSMENEETYSVSGDQYGTGVSDVDNKMQAAKVARDRGVRGKLQVTKQPNMMLSNWKATLMDKISNHPLLQQTPSLRKKYERMVTNAKQSSMGNVEQQLKTDLNIDSEGVVDGTGV